MNSFSNDWGITASDVNTPAPAALTPADEALVVEALATDTPTPEAAAPIAEILTAIAPEAPIQSVEEPPYPCFKVADETLGQIETFLTDSNLPADLRQEVEIRREELLTAQNGLLTAKSRLRDLCDAAHHVISRYRIRVIEEDLEKVQSALDSVAVELQLVTRKQDALQQEREMLQQKRAMLGTRRQDTLLAA